MNGLLMISTIKTEKLSIFLTLETAAYVEKVNKAMLVYKKLYFSESSTETAVDSADNADESTVG